MRPLFEHGQELQSLIAESSFAPQQKTALGADLSLVLARMQCRADAATARSLERSTTIRTGVRRAIGAAPLGEWGLAGAVLRRIARERTGPGFYGLQRIPDVETIRAVIREMQEEEKVAGFSTGTRPST